jgi:hypothetical protein
VAQVAEHLPSKLQAQNLNLSKQKKERIGPRNGEFGSEWQEEPEVLNIQFSYLCICGES